MSTLNRLVLSITLGLALLVLLWPALPLVRAAAPLADCLPTVTVTSAGDSDPGSLRQALADVCSGGTIDFDPGLAGQTIVLTTAELTIANTVTITNPVAPGLQISGDNARRVFTIQAGAVVTLSHLSIISGTAYYGGGIDNDGTLAVYNSTISGNSATHFGGGIRNSGTLTVKQSTFSRNSADSQGGGIYNDGTRYPLIWSISGYRVSQSEDLRVHLDSHPNANAYDIFLGSSSGTNYKICSGVATSADDRADATCNLAPTGIPAGKYSLFSTVANDASMLQVAEDNGLVEVVLGGEPKIQVQGGIIWAANSETLLNLLVHDTSKAPYTVRLFDGALSEYPTPVATGASGMSSQDLAWNVPDLKGEGFVKCGLEDGKTCLLRSYDKDGNVAGEEGVHINQPEIVLSRGLGPYARGELMLVSLRSHTPNTRYNIKVTGVNGTVTVGETTDTNAYGDTTTPVYWTIPDICGGGTGWPDGLYSFTSHPLGQTPQIGLKENVEFKTPAGPYLTVEGGLTWPAGSTINIRVYSHTAAALHYLEFDGERVPTQASDDTFETDSCGEAIINYQIDELTGSGDYELISYLDSSNSKQADLTITVLEKAVIQVLEGGAALPNETITIRLTNHVPSRNYRPINDNSATSDDGDIHNFSGTLAVEYSTFSGNSATGGSGGGIENNGILTVNYSTFSDNSALSAGGGILNTGPLAINYSTFNGNSASYGGGINSSGTLTVNDSTFSGNSATYNGGGVSSWGMLVVDHSTLSDNSAGNDGGGILNSRTLTIRNSIISGNSADWNGGGIDNLHSAGGMNPLPRITVEDSTISGNSAGRNGGGINNYDGLLTIDDSTFNHNSADGLGGGICTYYGVLTATNSTISSNLADDRGGGIYNDNRLTVDTTTINDNSAPGGGGIFNDGYGTVIVDNSTLSDNSASSGGGIYSNYYGTLTVDHSTFSGNSATTDGGGILNYSDSTLYLSNSILANNPSGGDCVNNGTIDTNLNNLIEDGSCSPAYSGDPLLAPLADYGGSTQTLALLPGSPAIDAGETATCLPTDQRGIPRPQGGGCDIGAFESQGFTLAVTGGNHQAALVGSPFAVPLGLTVTSQTSGEPVDGGLVTFTAPGTGPSATFAPTTTLTIVGGSVSLPVKANLTGGAYPVSATAAGANNVIFSLTNTPSELPRVYLPLVVK